MWRNELKQSTIISNNTLYEDIFNIYKGCKNVANFTAFGNIIS